MKKFGWGVYFFIINQKRFIYISGTIASLENILSQVVDWIKRSVLPDVNHALCQDRDDVLHQELSHIEVIAITQLRHVGLHMSKSLLEQLLKSCLLSS